MSTQRITKTKREAFRAVRRLCLAEAREDLWSKGKCQMGVPVAGDRLSGNITFALLIYAASASNAAILVFTCQSHRFVTPW